MCFRGAPWLLPSVLSCWGVCSPPAEWVRGFAAVCLSVCPPPFFLFGAVCLFLPLPSLGWCTHPSAFSVANQVAVGACGLLGRAPAPWVGWVMYTLGLVAFASKLGSGSAGWAVAQGGFVRPWVRGGGVLRVPPPLWCRL